MTGSGGATIKSERRAAARVDVFLYVVTMATAAFRETCMRGRMVVPGGLGIWLLVREMRWRFFARTATELGDLARCIKGGALHAPSEVDSVAGERKRPGHGRQALRSRTLHTRFG